MLHHVLGLPASAMAIAALRTAFRRARLVGWLVLLAGCGDVAGPGDPAFENPAPAGSRLPHLALTVDGRAVLSWVEPRSAGHALAFAVRGAAGWGPPVAVAEGTGWFVNWADFPSVQPLDNQLWAAHWLKKQPGGMYAYDIALALSRDGGLTWDPPLTPHHDGTPTEHGFVSMWPARLADGATGVGLVWLDGRNMFFDPSAGDAPEPRTVLRSAVFDAAGAEVAAAEVDDRVCDCCQTAAALTAAGPLVAYRNRSADEVRDIHIAALTPAAESRHWRLLGPVAADGWVIEGCPVNGPALAAGDSGLAVAWYTEASGTGQVLVAFGTGADAPWSAPVVVDDGATLGRVDVAALAGGDVAVSWLGDVHEGDAALLVARVSRDGVAGAPATVAVVAASRPAGVPQMVRHGDGLLLAWTEWRDGVSRVVTARVPGERLGP